MQFGSVNPAICPLVDDCMYATPPQTNADRIRAMTDKELADKVMAFIRCEACEREFHINCDVLKTCRGNWLDWLKQEVTE